MSWNPCMICRAIAWHKAVMASSYPPSSTTRETIDGFVERFAAKNYYNRPNRPCEKHEHDFTAALLRIGG